MMNNQYGAAPQQPRQNAFNVTTGLLSFFSADDSHMMLKINAMDNAMGISFCLPEQNASGKTTYPNNLRKNILLTLERVSALYHKISDVIMPAYKAGQAKKSGIFINRAQDTMLEIAVDSEGVFGLFLYEHVTTLSGLEPTKAFIFPMVEMYDDINPTTGGANVTLINAHFMLFATALGEFSKMYVSGHGARATNYYTISKIFEYLETIAAHFNLSLASNNGGYQNRQTTTAAPSGFQGFGQNPNATTSALPAANMQEVESLMGIVD